MSMVKCRSVGWGAAAVVLGVAILMAPKVGAEVAPYIAGVQPDQRPQGAPKITTYDKSGDWLARATRGVEKPHPPSLKFLDDQGAWFTPFTRPGMTGRYDIRHWHQPVSGNERAAGK